MAATAVVTLALLVAGLLLAQLGDAFRCAIAAISIARCYQLLGGGVITLQSLRLEVWPVGAADAGAFVPVDAQPFQTVEDVVNRAFGNAALVGVFYPHDELPIMATGEQPVEHGGANVADVRVPGRAGRIAHPNVIRHSIALLRYPYSCRPLIRAHVSRSVVVRLNTGAPGLVSRSAQK